MRPFADREWTTAGKWNGHNKSGPTTPMQTAARFTLKYPGRCAACNGGMHAGQEAMGMRAASQSRFIVWHTTAACNQIMLGRLAIQPPVVGTTTLTSDEATANPWLEAYDGQE